MECTSNSSEVISSELLLFQDILKCYEKEHIYMHQGLKTYDLAERLNSTIHEVSRSINKYSGMHFFDLTNYYRVCAAKKLLKSPEERMKYTIEGIAYQCGFANRTSFNRAFKKVVKMTPSEFKNLN
jgi:AraC-like DNA-binding protein